MPAKPGPASSKAKILAAATEVARREGAGNLSLDAIAAHAGVSKGGLLYHFPTKAALLRALVESSIADFETDMATGNPDQPALARYVDLALEEYKNIEPGASGVIAAMAEDPDFLKPIKVFQRRLLDQMDTGPAERARMLIVFLALEGLRSQRLFDLKVLTDGEIALVTTMLRDLSRSVCKA